MAANVINAMEALASVKNFSLDQYSNLYKIGINSAGSRFEYFIKDALVGKFFSDEDSRLKAYNNDYSWLGNQNNPPDAIAKNGDAFEIKKQENPNGFIALNSSPPNDMLYNDDPRLTKYAKGCDGGNWKEKDLFYIVGWVYKNTVKSIYFVQGKTYAASRECYDRISKNLSRAVKDAIKQLGYESSKTNELGRINNADPLGRASLRVRGMWQIQSPHVAFHDWAPLDKEAKFQAYAIMTKGKYASMNPASNNIIEKDAEIPDPNNPANRIGAVILEVIIK